MNKKPVCVYEDVPFSDEQCESINAYQNARVGARKFICADCDRLLVATTVGLVCTNDACTQTDKVQQEWAYAWQTDGTWSSYFPAMHSRRVK